VRARFIGGVKDKVVINPWPEPPPAYWSDDDGDYELFAIVREGEEALYKVAEGSKPGAPDALIGPEEAEQTETFWRWKPKRHGPRRVRPRPVKAGRRARPVRPER
jgi:hypothetical protein